MWIILVFMYANHNWVYLYLIILSDNMHIHIHWSTFDGIETFKVHIKFIYIEGWDLKIKRTGRKITET